MPTRFNDRPNKNNDISCFENANADFLISFLFNLKRIAMSPSRRHFIKNSALTATGAYMGSMAFPAKSYGRILGANDRVRVGVVGFSDRHRGSHMPCFMNHYKELNFDMVAV